MSEDEIQIRGASLHNLCGLDLSIPKRTITVVTGPSGAGKSSLVTGTIAARGLQNLELFAALLDPHPHPLPLSAMEDAVVDGLPPVLTLPRLRLTKSTHTIASFLALEAPLFSLWRTHGTRRCPKCGGHIESTSAKEALARVAGEFAGMLAAITASQRVSIDPSSPAETAGSELAAALRTHAERALAGGFGKFYVDGRPVDDSGLEEAFVNLEASPSHRFEIVIDRLKVTPENRERIATAITTARELGRGTCCCRQLASEAPLSRCFSAAGSCQRCDYESFDVVASMFGVRSHSEDGGAPSLLLPSLDAEQQREILSTMVGATTFAALLTAPLASLDSALSALNDAEHVSSLRAVAAIFEALGIAHLSLGDAVASLSVGEQQRVRLASTALSWSKGIAIVLDEPFQGLHFADTARVCALLRSVVDSGNTVIAAEQHPLLRRQAGHEITLGPGGGSDGGTIVHQGAPRVERAVPLFASGSRAPSQQRIRMHEATRRTLKKVSVGFPCERLTSVSGVSGSGKTTLVFGTLLPAVTARLSEGEAWTPRSAALSALDLPESIRRVTALAALEQSGSAASMVATYTDLFTPLRKLYAEMTISRVRGYTAATFGLAEAKRASGRCTLCLGTGTIARRGIDVADVCPRCLGTRYEREVLDVTFKGLSIAQLLSLTVSEALALLRGIPQCRPILERLVEMRLGYLALGQTTDSLSKGEYQRLRLTREMTQSPRGTLYLFDEPTAGLSEEEAADVAGLMLKLCEQGGTVIAIEHSLPFIGRSDYLVDMGPGAGPSGGSVLFEGRPSEYRGAATPTARAMVEYERIGARTPPSALHEPS